MHGVIINNIEIKDIVSVKNDETFKTDISVNPFLCVHLN